jgi:hypothetical protein
LGEDEHLIVNGQVIPVIRSSGNKKRSIIEAIFNLRTLMKVVEQKASRFGGSNGVDGSVGKKEGSCHHYNKRCPCMPSDFIGF